MTVHSVHTPVSTHGLADDCPRCAEHAVEPFAYLDDESLKALVDRTVAWMRNEEFPRSKTETAAMRVVETAIVRMRMMLRVSPALAEEVRA